MAIVAGIDSSTTRTRIVACDAETGAVLRDGRAPHPTPEGGDPRATEVDPQLWLHSLGEAATGGLLEGVRAIGVSAQQHGLIGLDAGGVLVRPALLWNDPRSAGAAAQLIDALGGPEPWVRAIGSVPAPTYTVAKLRWLAEFEPTSAKRIAEVLLPHDWLVWQLLGHPKRRTTDRGDASGTGYWSPLTGEYRQDLIELALGHELQVPDVLGPAEPAGHTPEGLLISAGTGDNMAAALGLGLGPGDAVVSLGGNGTIFAVHDQAVVDVTGAVSSFADATGRHLPMVGTLNAAQVLRSMAGLLGTDLAGLSELALQSSPGAYGLVLLPYLDGERTPQLPHAAGTLTGLRAESMTPQHLARAAVEGMLCNVADAVDVLRDNGVTVRRIFLLGAVGRLPAVREAAPLIFGVPVVIPPAGDHAARGAARQAAWALAGTAEPPHWELPEAVTLAAERDSDLAVGSSVRQQYRTVRDQVHPELASSD
ncbi:MULTISPECIES: FGGY family carbohydrate kinase [unclassified Kitasatospora]|uniref:FGGY family carbohydrate kinase n=1 Tax=unclassified Kitasatospora TaxID=2633591 RepID=UPI00070DB969|nr:MULTISPECIES: FGGY family carbohydrate kinase [unclassified Kitasatospora]KQV05570.1 sugar kinase [Kitasatospora sp. Root107]KRB62372.1 sugar kinase [Kitasatospora sp. Root187]